MSGDWTYCLKTRCMHICARLIFITVLIVKTRHYHWETEKSLHIISVMDYLFLKWAYLCIQMADLPLGRPMNLCYWQCHFLKHVAKWISLNLSVYEGLDSFCIYVFWAHAVILFVLFLLVIPNPVAFLLNVTSTVMFWMSACQSILCTVHLTWSLCRPGDSFYELLMWLCCWVVDLRPPSAVFPSWHVNVCILVWGFLCG